MLRYVELASEARTPLADFFSILLDQDGRRVRDGILNVPSRVSVPCAAETDQHTIHALLTRELT
ncbi:MAG TPA: hypothetical protein VGQ08_08210 [Nitrospiraceae bacterium]|jgi:hypothetical protein|nr:hypothetical protein [Nitrospiraceae bacterium]